MAALAVVSMAFAQTVSVFNKLESVPKVTIDGAKDQWGFDEDNFLRDTIQAKAVTADGRAEFEGRARFMAQTRSTDNASILNVSPRWQFTGDLAASGLIRPIDGLELRIIGNKDFLTKGFGPSLCWRAWEQYNAADIAIPGITGAWNNPQVLMEGMYAAYTGIDGLWVGAGLNKGIASGVKEFGTQTIDDNVWNGRKGDSSWIKKGAFGPFTVGATYDADLFGVGGKYVGEFGGYNGTAGENGKDDSNTGKFNHHNIYAGFTFKGLADAKVGTTIGAAVDFDTYSASSVMDTKAYTGLAATVNADMNFRNGITDMVAVTVGYGTYDGKKSKVLPFYIGNDLGYKVSDDASFNLHTSYMQGALNNAKKTYTDQTKVGDALFANYASLITLKPEFTFNMGAHSFNFGVETQVANQIKYNQKTSADWAFTSMYGKKAVVKFPMSWTYNF
ncbi:MAG: hypothetical protein MJ196_12650 [Treponemataceae bacterium]|nr:hypothetical protein [Treponemataceae bacterium]